MDTGGHKWMWALVILFGNLLGAVVYLAVGRQYPPITDSDERIERAQSNRGQARNVADLLYGEEDRR